jgi:hypothetical protein
MNAKAGALQDIRVRQAINQAIDREAVVREAFFGKAEVPGYISPAAEAGYDSSHLELSSFDPEDRAGASGGSGCGRHDRQPDLRKLRLLAARGSGRGKESRDVGLNVTTEYSTSHLQRPDVRPRGARARLPPALAFFPTRTGASRRCSCRGPRRRNRVCAHEAAYTGRA